MTTEQKQGQELESRPRIVLVNRCVVLDDYNRILIMQRSENDYYMPNKWEIPGGKLDEGQSVSDALEREVLEETGLLVTPFTRLAFIDSHLLTTGKYKGLPYVGIVGIAQVTGGIIRLSEEHQAHTWTNLQEAFLQDLTPETRKALAGMAGELQQKYQVISEGPTPDEVLTKYSHPAEKECLKDPLVKELVLYLDLVENGLWETLHPDGAYKDDNYFRFEEGMVMRRTQLVRFIVEFFRAQGKLRK